MHQVINPHNLSWSFYYYIEMILLYWLSKLDEEKQHWTFYKNKEKVVLKGIEVYCEVVVKTEI